MKSIRNILYSTDFSESTLAAAEYALTLAKLTGAKLHVLHVVGELADARRSMVPPSALVQLEKEVEIHAVKAMEAFCRSHFVDKVPFETHVVHGIPFKEILTQAEALAADLIVLGTHGRTGIEHVIVGSTAERVVRRSQRAVLTVRTPE